MTANEFLIDAATRHQVFVERFAGGETKKARELLKRLRDRILERLRRTPEQLRASQLRLILEDVSGMLTEFGEEYSQQMLDMVEEFAESETDFQANLLEEVTVKTNVQLPAPSMLRQAVLERGMDVAFGRRQITIREMLDGFAEAKSSEVLREIQDRVILGDTGPEINAAVSELIDNRHSRHIETVTRTTVNHTANQAAHMTHQANSDILQGYEWVATLDSRVTLLCAGRDSKVYPIGDGPLPPAHYGCRSVVVPALRDEFALEGLDGDRGAYDGSIGFGGWFKKQPKSFQDEFLGETRADLYRKGGFTIERFRDETGRVYTLDELKRLEPLAFEKAGVELD